MNSAKKKEEKVKPQTNNPNQPQITDSPLKSSKDLNRNSWSRERVPAKQFSHAPPNLHNHQNAFSQSFDHFSPSAFYPQTQTSQLTQSFSSMPYSSTPQNPPSSFPLSSLRQAYHKGTRHFVPKKTLSSESPNKS